MSNTHSDQEIVIEPIGGWFDLNLIELWRYRDLFVVLVRRDIVVRYRQSVIGVGWAILRPVIAMAVFTFVFGRVAGISSEGAPYALFAFSALLPWMYFAGTVTAGTTSVSGSSHLIQKVYFPRIILPLVSVVTGLVELVVQFVVLLILMMLFSYWPGVSIVLAPVFLLLGGLVALSVGLWLTALNVRYRDIGQAVPFMVQIWMWLSPVIYPTSAVSEELRPLYSLNPMVGVIEGFRWSVLGSVQPDWRLLVISLSMTVAVGISGLIYFRRTETTFPDVI